MTDAVVSWLHVLLGLVGVLGTTPSGGLAIGAIVVVAAVVVALLSASATPSHAVGGLVRPCRSIDVSVTPPQSDPDAAGHPRSRAPGLAVSAA